MVTSPIKRGRAIAGTEHCAQMVLFLSLREVKRSLGVPARAMKYGGLIGGRTSLVGHIVSKGKGISLSNTVLDPGRAMLIR